MNEHRQKNSQKDIQNELAHDKCLITFQVCSEFSDMYSASPPKKTLFFGGLLDFLSPSDCDGWQASDQIQLRLYPAVRLED
eukprot:3810550-Amphidinium_carterae.1